MQAVVGVVRHYSEAERIVEALREIEVSDRHISVLSPGSSEAAIRRVPTTEAEQPGIGRAIGSVVGGATGTASGLAVASVALRGVGPVIAAGAIAVGLLGEMLYRLGFDAAFRLSAEAPPFDEARSILRDRHGPLGDELAFRTGYDRGRAHRSGSQGAGVGPRDATDGPALP